MVIDEVGFYRDSHTGTRKFKEGILSAKLDWDEDGDGEDIGNSNVVPNNGTNLHDEYDMMAAYYSTNDVRTYFPKPLNISFGEEFDTFIMYF